MTNEEAHTKIGIIYNIVLSFVTDVIDAEDSMKLIDEVLEDRNIMVHKALYETPEDLICDEEEDEDDTGGFTIVEQE